MNGPEHYLEAEKLLATANHVYILGMPGLTTETHQTFQAAQIHATLALAAATALGSASADKKSWHEVAS